MATSTGNMNSFNANFEYLEMVVTIMKQYIQADFDLDYKKMFKSLKHLNILLLDLGKQDEEINKGISEIRRLLPTWRVKRGGRIIAFPEIQSQMEEHFDKTYELLLKKTDKVGLLRKKHLFSISESFKET